MAPINMSDSISSTSLGSISPMSPVDIWEANGPIALGEVIDGRYRCGKLIGQGGFGTVYEAEHLRFGGRVALKLLDRSDQRTIRRFNQEARIAGTILHPNVCRVFDVGWVKERPFIVMELLSGDNLATRLERKGPIKVANAIDVAIQVLAGLGAAHDVGVVHRDVKPQNVFLVSRQGCSPMVKLLDFGLAKALSKEIRPTATLPGKIVGTIAYMSPEQLHGDRIDARSDLFSCGVLLYEIITGVLPWAGRTPGEIGASILRDQPRPLPQTGQSIPPELAAILAHALTKDRNHRFQSAIEFMRALGALQRTQPAIVPFAVSPGLEDEGTTHISWRAELEKDESDDDEATTNITTPQGLALPNARQALPKTASSSDTMQKPWAFRTALPDPTVPRLYTVPPISRGPLSTRNVPPPSRRRRGSSS
jgi:serine/threonine-protein kinase